MEPQIYKARDDHKSHMAGLGLSPRSHQCPNALRLQPQARPQQNHNHNHHSSHSYVTDHPSCRAEYDDSGPRAPQPGHARPEPLATFLIELLGTLLFVYLAQATLTSYELTGTQNDFVARQFATILTSGLAYLLAVLITLGLSGAHLNPAYSFASATFGLTRWTSALTYIAAQYIGSFLAAVLLHATYNDKIAQRHSEGLLTGMNSTLRAHGNILSTGKLFSSYPPTEVSLMQLFVSYSLASCLLAFFLLSIHQCRLLKLPSSLKPIHLAAALVLVQASFAANGGPVLNPAQDFSPRLYIAFFGWGSSAFNIYHGHYWWLCGILAPHLGALLGFAVHNVIAQPFDPKLGRHITPSTAASTSENEDSFTTDNES